MSSPQHWPVFTEVVRGFYNQDMARPRKLFNAFVATGRGSGRRAGPRKLYWQAVVAFAVAALEAGLEDLVFAAHAVRQESQGQLIKKGSNSVDSNPRKWLVADRLMAPSAQRLERVLFADFGVVLGAIPADAQFAARKKESSKGGSGRGEHVEGPTTWSGLRIYLETMSHMRNATAHGDAEKLTNPPRGCEGLLWLRTDDGLWSVQQPHALTALRTALAVFNTTAVALADRLATQVPKLTSPNTVDYPTS